MTFVSFTRFVFVFLIYLDENKKNPLLTFLKKFKSK